MRMHIQHRRCLPVFILTPLLTLGSHAYADCPAQQSRTASELAAQAAQSVDEIDRLLLLKRSVKVCPNYLTWLELGKVEMQLENSIDAAYAFENAVDFYREDKEKTYSIDQVQRQAVANGWLAEAYLANGEVALALVATQEGVGAFEALGQPVPQRLLDTQAQLDDAMSGASADVLVRSMEIQHNRATRGIGVKPRIREQQVALEQEQQTLDVMSDYTGTPVSLADNATVDVPAVTDVPDVAEVQTEPSDSSTTPASTQATLNIPVLFEFDSAVLTRESGQTIDQLAEALVRLDLEPGDTVKVVGHTDSRGAAAYNLDLSQRRAESVLQVLRAVSNQGALADVGFVSEGRGEAELRYVGNSRDDHRRNRRVEVIVIR